jgi:hypothetical protein
MRAAAIVSLLLATTASAQGAAVVPAWAASTEGNRMSHLPYLYDASRTQMVVAGSAFCNAVAQINGMELRRDGVEPSPYAARTLPSHIVTVGYAATTPATMSTTFASNRGPGQTVVMSGAFNLPAQPVVPAPAPFNIVLPFSTPLLYVRAQGDLLVEIEIPGTATTRVLYYLDAQDYASGAGTVAGFGTSGAVQAGDRLVASCATTGLAPGGSANTTISGASKAYPTLHWIGASNTSFFGVPLPLDLTGVGAPTNHLYASMALAVGVTMTGGLGGFSGVTNWPIPNDPGLGGAIVYAQWLILDPPSNAAGLVTSHGLRIGLAGGSAQVVLNLMGTSISTAATGSFMFPGPGGGGPVVRLLGVFG